VAKFGGTSLASAPQIAKVVAILRADPDRRFLVVSAPGKRHGRDTKVTDLLYRLFDERHLDYTATWAAIKQRFRAIAEGLGVDLDLAGEFAAIEARLPGLTEPDYVASRGEYLTAKILAAHLGWPFLEVAEAIRFSDEGRFLAEETDELLGRALSGLPYAVVPGFYGATAAGVIKTLPRGGSDVSGALVARAANADVYENWSDVSGMLMADPRVVANPRPISRVSYSALRELTYMGASVLHEDAVNPVRESGIPINIRNTDSPGHEGTWIEAEVRRPQPGDPAIIGLSGKRHYTALTLRKPQWRGSSGASGILFGLCREYKIVIDLALTGIDGLTVAISTRALSPVWQELSARITDLLQPATMEVEEGLSLLGVVSSGILPRTTVTGRIATCLSYAGIEVSTISHMGDLHLLTVPTWQLEEAIRTIYEALAR
jgi:aspartate kinase